MSDFVKIIVAAAKGIAEHCSYMLDEEYVPPDPEPTPDTKLVLPIQYLDIAKGWDFLVDHNNDASDMRVKIELRKYPKMEEKRLLSIVFVKFLGKDSNGSDTFSGSTMVTEKVDGAAIETSAIGVTGTLIFDLTKILTDRKRPTSWNPKDYIFFHLRDAGFAAFDTKKIYIFGGSYERTEEWSEK